MGPTPGGEGSILAVQDDKKRSMEWVAFRAFWMMEELGPAYELRMLLFPPLALAPQFLEVNPLVIVPAMFMANPM